MTIDFFTIYIQFIHDLMINENIDLSEVSHTEAFQNFRRQNLINFQDAARVDNELFGHSGGYWTSAYNYPREGQDIYRNQNGVSIYLGRAVDVGILTFHIE